MKATKHTPGPWGLEIFPRAAEWDVTTVNLPICSGYYTSEEGKANARLIAAAPDLLDALESAVECGMVPLSSATEGGACRYSKQVEAADQIRAAITKATQPES